MAHKASKRSRKYRETYWRERVVPLYNERVEELYELAQKGESLQLPTLHTPDATWISTRLKGL